MSDQSAIRLLQTAIETVRDTCTGPEYKSLLAACESCDKAAESALTDDSGSAEPKDLKSAAAKAREQFAEKRKSDSSASK